MQGHKRAVAIRMGALREIASPGRDSRMICRCDAASMFEVLSRVACSIWFILDFPDKLRGSEGFPKEDPEPLFQLAGARESQ
jgi:hypothetical protein